jgi:SAM-dependent methyltransferase
MGHASEQWIGKAPGLPVERLQCCPCCGSQRLDELPTPGHWIGRDVFSEVDEHLKLERCTSCSLAFVNPRPSSELLARFYSGMDYDCHAANDNDSTRSKAEFVLAAIEAHTPAGRRLLDFGTGGGWLLRRAKERSWFAVGYDVGARSVRVCREQGLFVTGDLDSLAAGSFDAVLLHHVLEHLTDPQQTLERIARLMAPGAHIFIEVPNAQSLRARLSPPMLSRHAGLDERYRAFPIHLLYFSPKALDVLLDRSGFQLQSLTTHGFGLDELLFRENEPDNAYTTAPIPRLLNVKRKHRSRASRVQHALSRVKRGTIQKVKTRVKDELFSRLLGESLFAVATLAR